MLSSSENPFEGSRSKIINKSNSFIFWRIWSFFLRFLYKPAYQDEQAYSKCHCIRAQQTDFLSFSIKNEHVFIKLPAWHCVIHYCFTCQLIIQVESYILVYIRSQCLDGVTIIPNIKCLCLYDFFHRSKKNTLFSDSLLSTRLQFRTKFWDITEWVQNCAVISIKQKFTLRTYTDLQIIHITKKKKGILVENRM